MPALPGSDEYFNRSAAVVTETPAQRQLVRYCVFARESGLICGLDRAVPWITEQTRGPLTVRALRDGDEFRANETVMVLEGEFGELVTLETMYLGLLSLSAGATEMSRIVAAAPEVPVIDMSARHFPPELTEEIAYAAAIGGARGTSTQAGQRYVLRRLGMGDNDLIRVAGRTAVPFGLYGTIPHALNAVFEGNSVASAAAYHARFPDVPLTVLIDFEGRELDICRDAARRFGRELHAVRLDTHGGRIHQGGHAEPDAALVERILSAARDKAVAQAALERYGFGPGVTIEGAFNVRRALDEAGAARTRIVLTGGFDAQKVAAFRTCGAPFDAVGTGSWVRFWAFTSDITHVLDAAGWVERAKAGRASEIISRNLPTRFERT